MKKEIEYIESLAKEYAEYSNKNTKYGHFGQRCADLTPKGKKAAATRKYNKFADACENAGLSLKEQSAILKKYF